MADWFSRRPKDKTHARVAATLGFGALQINQGLHFLFKTPSNFAMQVAIIIIATILFTWSASSIAPPIGPFIIFVPNIGVSVALTKPGYPLWKLKYANTKATMP